MITLARMKNTDKHNLMKLVVRDWIIDFTVFLQKDFFLGGDVLTFNGVIWIVLFCRRASRSLTNKPRQQHRHLVNLEILTFYIKLLMSLNFILPRCVKQPIAKLTSIQFFTAFLLPNPISSHMAWQRCSVSSLVPSIPRTTAGFYQDCSCFQSQTNRKWFFPVFIPPKE